MQHPCNQCKGTGETISDKDRCPHCKGEKVVQEKKVLEVHVEKGMQNSQKITFPGEADEAVSQAMRDVTFFSFLCLFPLTPEVSSCGGVTPCSLIASRAT